MLFPTEAYFLKRLNEMVSHILAAYYHFGQDFGYPAVNFDAQHSDGSGALNLGVSVRSAAHTALVREIGAAAAVLLKNNHTAVSGVTTRGLLLALARIKSMAAIKSFVGTSATIATSLTYDLTAGPAAAKGAFFAMSGALGSYTVVVDNMGD
ncbi:hypothetical protein C8J57DRAFT_1516856 [Mycena rebaudengoi]|nr:hypothetical protein C8J57DRAFT_1516856 [Mycena rebaudengoi]